ncbi:hypothetical protein BT96DRAFT_1062335 [Gymnopus androsaceus JB14]|uniref:Uncharacterized protein n=1 Tax=Gymnopus androsaceus JB14 TaxID=1447944 RepID=A0A6A4H115_9AGAR|nr:hypothetical protein BT96DRAFT_1062335 [Gymnopus androsaceus JB14]
MVPPCTESLRNPVISLYPVPSYEPGVDDDDRSTWSKVTCFAEALPALDHTAQHQFQGSVELGTKIATTYSESPLALRDGKQMEPDDYFRKQNFHNADHAADGKKKFKLTADKKEQIANQDLGREKMDDMSATAILHEMLKITDADIAKAAWKSVEKLSTEERGKISMDLLEQRIGKQAFDALPEAESRILHLFIFIGCGAHKSLNAFCYGVVEMRDTWKWEGLKGPCDLANKSHELATKIAANNNNTEASKRCEKSCPRGGVKLCELAGALFRHKDGETGIRKSIVCLWKLGNMNSTIFRRRTFPDVSNTRYQSHSYAVAELLVFRDDYQELVEEICDGKTKQGPNHLEGNVLKGLQDPDTLAELGAMALEGVTVSWPYMGLIRSPPEGQKFVNALSPEMVKLHRNKIIPFCENFALHPEKVLDPSTPLNELTLDGEPLIDETIIPTLCMLAPQLPNLNLMISAMFRGTANGWRLFTTEYTNDPDDSRCIASLSPELLALLGQIPMTNDSNEGILGSLRKYIKFNPSSDAHTFSSLTRSKRNNLEAFISKLCQPDDQSYVMHLARELDESGEVRRFRDQYLKLQKERAELSRKRVEDIARKRADELKRLNDIGVITDCALIKGMKLPQLKDQFRQHKHVRRDPELANVTQSSLKNKQAWLDAILAAVERMGPDQ